MIFEQPSLLVTTAVTDKNSLPPISSVTNPEKKVGKYEAPSWRIALASF
jgi:hypothetical protein